MTYLRRLGRFVLRWRATLAWTANIVIISLLLAGLYATQQRLEREALERDYMLCTNTNEARAGLVAFVKQIIGDSQSQQAQEILDLAHESFAPLECPPDPSPGGTGG